MDTILILGLTSVALLGIGLTGLAVLLANWIDYQVACWHYGRMMSHQQQAQVRQASKRVIEIRIS